MVPGRPTISPPSCVFMGLRAVLEIIASDASTIGLPQASQLRKTFFVSEAVMPGTETGGTLCFPHDLEVSNELPGEASRDGFPTPSGGINPRLTCCQISSRSSNTLRWL